MIIAFMQSAETEIEDKRFADFGAKAKRWRVSWKWSHASKGTIITAGEREIVTLFRNGGGWTWFIIHFSNISLSLVDCDYVRSRDLSFCLVPRCKYRKGPFFRKFHRRKESFEKEG